MKRFDPRVAIGLLLIVGGTLTLLQRMGYLQNASNVFWGSLFLTAGLIFIALLASGTWWSAFPGFTLASIGILILLPDSLSEFGRAIFLGGISLAFWFVYFTGRTERWWALIPAGVLTILALVTIVSERSEALGGALFLGGIGLAFWITYFSARGARWWALIPAGVMSTLAVVALFTDRLSDFQSAGVFFLGLALTFLLVALLAGMRWAYWPAGSMGVLGLLAMASLLDAASYVYAAALIAAGGYLLFRYFANR